MIEIPLAGGGVSLIDEADHAVVSQFKWHRVRYKSKNNVFDYAQASTYTPTPACKTGKIKMHRLLMNAPAGVDVDHINGDGLDNRRSNMRLCSRTQNNMNQGFTRGGASKYKGVHFHGQVKKWVACISINNKTHHLGLFICPELAAVAYNTKAIKREACNPEHYNRKAKHDSYYPTRNKGVMRGNGEKRRSYLHGEGRSQEAGEGGSLNVKTIQTLPREFSVFNL